MSLRTKPILASVVLLGALLMVGYAAISVAIFDRITTVYPECGDNAQGVNNTPADFERDGFDTTSYFVDVYQDVTLESRGDGTQLSAWFIPQQPMSSTEDAGTIIIAHGHNDCKGSAPVLMAAGMLAHKGFNVLAIDLRDHGSSQIADGRTTGGLDEYRDVLGAWDWLQQEKDTPAERIGLMGFSLGAASSLIAAGEETGVQAVWEDSSFANVNQIVESELSRNGFPLIFGPATSVVSRLLTGVDILSSGPIDAIQKADGRSYFFVHGDADARIPVEHAQQLAVAARESDGEVESWIVPEAGHTEAIFKVPLQYETNLVTFFTSALVSNNSS